MKHISKTGEPQSFTLFKRSNPQGWSVIHEPANKHVYDDCLMQSVNDQNNLCAYTEICLDHGLVHIDHYVKRDIDPRLTFCWENLFAAVKDYRYGADWKDSHIKHNDYDLVNHRYFTIMNPIADDFLNKFKFATDGTIEPCNRQDTMASETISVFNLNEDTLKSRRRDAMKAARDMVAGGMEKRDVFNYLAVSGFVSAIEYELSFA